MSLEVFLPLQFSATVSEDRCYFSKCMTNSPVKLSGPGLLFAGRLLITVSISMLVMGLLRFLFLPGSVLDSCTFLRICLFLPGCPFYWHIVADGSLL